MNIPVLIHYLILGYYFHGEYFEKAGDDLEISNDKMSVERVSVTEGKTYRNNVYCKKWIKSNMKQIVT